MIGRSIGRASNIEREYNARMLIAHPGTVEEARAPGRDEAGLRAQYAEPFHGLDPEVAKEVTSLAYTLDLPRSTMNELLGRAQANLNRYAATREPTAEEDLAETRRVKADLRQRWRGAYESNMELVREMLDHYPNLLDQINEPRLDHSVGFWEQAFKIAWNAKVLHKAQGARRR
jgi:hypothetical protein